MSGDPSSTGRTKPGFHLCKTYVCDSGCGLAAVEEYCLDGGTCVGHWGGNHSDVIRDISSPWGIYNRLFLRVQTRFRLIFRLENSYTDTQTASDLYFDSARNFDWIRKRDSGAYRPVQ